MEFTASAKSFIRQSSTKRGEGLKTIKGLVIGGTRSGCGKTTVSLGLMAALRRRGLKVAPFKVGPDFIDPGYHSLVSGVASRNLDGWMLSETYNRQSFGRGAAGSDIAIIEGVMGLFDGYDGKSEAGSTAQMAKWLGLPVLLLVDAASMARSAAALVAGFENFDPSLTYAGVLFNNLGSRRHLRYLEQAVAGHVKMPCLGGIIRSDAVVIPERHLGLVTREDHPLDEKSVERLADLVENSMDLDALLERLAETELSVENDTPRSEESHSSVRIAVARDSAFCFYYPDNLELLEDAGAELIEFSPVSDRDFPPDIDGVYLGGGYPELYAEKLAQNTTMRNALKEKSIRDMPIYGECGGFMYLCRELYDRDGRRFPMSGCFPFASRMFSRLKALGYREISLTRDTIIGARGLILRGHEFHYSELVPSDGMVATVYRITDRAGMDKHPDGYCIHRTLGSYNHLHFGSQPDSAVGFVENCRLYRRERQTGS
jgi:cobyrinic acid a,c-diamide synthase